MRLEGCEALLFWCLAPFSIEPAEVDLYAALGHGPVALVSPLIATYPLVTLLLSSRVLKRERVNARLVASVAIIVGGVVLLLIP
jgi:drug/metabolite transporter (DMT)-like permease